MPKPTKRSTQGKPKANKQTLKGTGDYTVADAQTLNRVESKLDALNKKVPNVAGAGKSALTSIGSRVGGLFGMPDIGKKAGEGLSSILGFGDYQILHNSLIPGNKATIALESAIVPKFGSDGKRGVRIREREYIGDVLSSTGFSNKSYPINPGDVNTFPWLSQFANLFDQWEPHGIVFEFVSTSSDFNGAGQGLGAVVLATDYDITDPVFSTKQIMESSDYANSTKPSNSAMHGIECDPNERPTRVLFVSSPYTTLAPTQLYTLGNFQVATQGMSTPGVTLGELWVSYDVTFYKKAIDTIGMPSFSASGTSGTLNPLGPNPTFGPFNSPALTYVVSSTVGTTWYLPPNLGAGTFLVSYYGSNFVSAAAGLLWGGAYNCSFASVRFAPVGAVTPYMWSIVVTVSGKGAHFDLSIGGGAATTYAFSLSQVPLNFSF